MRGALVLSVCVAYATSACTSRDLVAPAALTAFQRSTSDDFVRMPAAGGGVVTFGPNATLNIEGGQPTEIAAGDLYTNEEGLFKKNGEPICSWRDLRRVSVEQVDGAATVALTATVAIAAVAIAAFLKSAPSGGGGKGGGGKGGSAPKAPRSAPNPPSVTPDPGLTEVVFRTAEAASNMPANGSVTVGAPDETEPSTAMPLFSRGARRRANIRVLGRLEGGACWPRMSEPGGASGDCLVSGARAGVRILDILELTGGVRVESDATRSQPLAVFGVMLHGEAPSAHWFALAAGASVAFDGDFAHVIPEVAFRFRPVRGLWLGLVPVEPVYRTESGTFTMASGVELSGEL